MSDFIAGYAASPRRCAYYPISGAIVAALRADLVGHETSSEPLSDWQASPRGADTQAGKGALGGDRGSEAKAEERSEGAIAHRVQKAHVTNTSPLPSSVQATALKVPAFEHGAGLAQAQSKVLQVLGFGRHRRPPSLASPYQPSQYSSPRTQNDLPQVKRVGDGAAHAFGSALTSTPFFPARQSLGCWIPSQPQTRGPPPTHMYVRGWQLPVPQFPDGSLHIW